MKPKAFLQENFKTIVIVVAVGLGWWLWTSASNAEVRYEMLKASTAKETIRLEKERVELRDQVKDLLSSNERLVSRIDTMAVENRRIAGEILSVRKEALFSASNVSNMPLDNVATSTLEALEMKPPAIRTTTDGFMLMEQPAARVNLEHLILGDAARVELGLTNKRITNFKQQIATGREIHTNLQEILAKREQELDNLSLQHHAELDLRKAELRAVRKVARRDKVLYAAVGVAIGFVTARR